MSLAILLALVALVLVVAAGVGALFGVVFVAGRSSNRAQVRDSHRESAA